MAWVTLVCLALILWAACGAVMTVARRTWTLETALRVHLAAATVIAFLISAVHKMLAPDFPPTLRAAAITGLIVILDATVVAPLFEHSYAMFRSVIGTWAAFAAIFLASWAAGIWIPA